MNKKRYQVKKCKVIVFKNKNGRYRLDSAEGNFFDKEIVTDNYEKDYINNNYCEIDLKKLKSENEFFTGETKRGESITKIGTNINNPSQELMKLMDSNINLTLHKIYSSKENGKLTQLFIEEI